MTPPGRENIATVLSAVLEGENCPPPAAAISSLIAAALPKTNNLIPSYLILDELEFLHFLLILVFKALLQLLQDLDNSVPFVRLFLVYCCLECDIFC